MLHFSFTVQRSTQRLEFIWQINKNQRPTSQFRLNHKIALKNKHKQTSFLYIWNTVIDLKV